MSTHTQVKLRKGTAQQITWIPSWAARRGNIVELKEEGGIDPGWEVIETYGTLPDHVLKERQKDYRNTRKASDI